MRIIQLLILSIFLITVFANAAPIDSSEVDAIDEAFTRKQKEVLRQSIVSIGTNYDECDIEQLLYYINGIAQGSKVKFNFFITIAIGKINDFSMHKKLYHMLDPSLDLISYISDTIQCEYNGSACPEDLYKSPEELSQEHVKNEIPSTPSEPSSSVYDGYNETSGSEPIDLDSLGPLNVFCSPDYGSKPLDIHCFCLEVNTTMDDGLVFTSKLTYSWEITSPAQGFVFHPSKKPSMDHSLDINGVWGIKLVVNDESGSVVSGGTNVIVRDEKSISEKSEQKLHICIKRFNEKSYEDGQLASRFEVKCVANANECNGPQMTFYEGAQESEGKCWESCERNNKVSDTLAKDTDECSIYYETECVEGFSKGIYYSALTPIEACSKGFEEACNEKCGQFTENNTSTINKECDYRGEVKNSNNPDEGDQYDYGYSCRTEHGDKYELYSISCLSKTICNCDNVSIMHSLHSYNGNDITFSNSVFFTKETMYGKKHYLKHPYFMSIMKKEEDFASGCAWSFPDPSERPGYYTFLHPETGLPSAKYVELESCYEALIKELPSSLQYPGTLLEWWKGDCNRPASPTKSLIPSPDYSNMKISID